MTLNFTQELALINGVDDFNLKDIWEPTGKKFRTLLSGIINFLRYKDQQQSMITSLKESLRTLQSQRLEQEQQSEQMDKQLHEAHVKHNEELPLMYAADSAAHEAKSTLDKVQKDVKSGEHLLESVGKRRDQWQERVTQSHDEVRRLREDVSQLRGRVAESPEDLQQQIVYLRERIPQQRERGEELHEEKRTLGQKVQGLAKLRAGTSEYLNTLREMLADQSALNEVRQRKSNTSAELAALRESTERQRMQHMQLEQNKENITAGIENDKQAQAERVRHFEDRRQRAIQERQEQMEHASEEQRRQFAQQVERSEMEAKLRDVQRAHQAQMSKLQARRQEIAASMEDFKDFAEKEFASSYVDVCAIPIAA